jgi:general secretion pathway protein J
MTAKTSQRGFTLFEIMIAVSILGLIGMLTFGTFSRAVNGRERAEEITEYYHGVRQAMTRMAHEIEMAYVSTHHDCAEPRTKTIFATKNASGGMRLDFTAFTHFKVTADANESDEEELSYFIDTDPDDPKKKALIRRSQSRIDLTPREGGVEQVLAHNVSKLEFEFYDAKVDKTSDEWDTSNLDTRDRMPLFVTIKLWAVNPRGKEEQFTTRTRVQIRNAILIAGTGFTHCVDY